MSNEEGSIREAIITELQTGRGINSAETPILIELFSALADLSEGELRRLTSESSVTHQGREPKVRVLALRDLVRVNDIGMKFPLAASSRVSSLARQPKARQPMTPVFEHLPDGLQLFDGPDGTICLSDALGIDLIQIGPIWGRPVPSSTDGFVMIPEVSCGALRELWENEQQT